MASRPGFPPPAKTSPTSISTAHVDNIMRSYRHEQVVYALMTQLREKESELTSLSEQRMVILRQQQITEDSNKQLKGRIDVHNKSSAEKDTRIAVLEKKLSYERNSNGAAIAEANLKHLTETNAECKRVLQERDNELSILRPMAQDLKAKVDEYESKAHVQLNEQLEEELAKIKGELTIAEDKHLKSSSAMEGLEKKVKGKEWMIKSLQEESNDQRSRENHLLYHIKALNEKIETYETKFKGKGIDVPILLAKLKDYEVRTKDLQGQVRRLTNKKLNELVLRSSPVPHQFDNNKESNTVSRSNSEQDEAQQYEADNESKASNRSFSDDEEATFATNATDEMDDPFYLKSAQDEEDVLGDFLLDVKVGIESMKMEGLCCVTETQGPSPTPMASPLSDYSPSSYGSSQRYPSSSYNSSQTFTSGSQTQYLVKKSAA